MVEACEIQRAADALASGDLVIMPTDTVYGVAADARIPEAVEKIYAAKGRDRNKPLPLLVSGLAAAESYGGILGSAEKTLAEKFWPGALTLVLRMAGNESAEEAFRVPDNATALDLLSAAGGLLRVTSANRSGEPPALTAEDAGKALGAAAAVVLDAGPVTGGAPSTVARVAAGPRVEILREGSVDRRTLESALAGEGRK